MTYEQAKKRRAKRGEAVNKQYWLQRLRHNDISYERDLILNLGVEQDPDEFNWIQEERDEILKELCAITYPVKPTAMDIVAGMAHGDNVPNPLVKED